MCCWHFRALTFFSIYFIKILLKLVIAICFSIAIFLAHCYSENQLYVQKILTLGWENYILWEMQRHTFSVQLIFSLPSLSAYLHPLGCPSIAGPLSSRANAPDRWSSGAKITASMAMESFLRIRHFLMMLRPGTRGHCAPQRGKGLCTKKKGYLTRAMDLASFLLLNLCS